MVMCELHTSERTMKATAAQLQSVEVIESLRNRYEVQARREAERALEASVSGVAEVLRGSSEATMERAALEAFDDAPYSEMLSTIYTMGLVDFATVTDQQLKHELPQGMRRKEEDRWREFIQAYLAGVSATKVQQISDTTRNALRILLADLQGQGLGMEEIARRVSRQMPEIHRLRAVVIARTEIINASNAASAAGASTLGMEVRKEWISVSDSRTRGHHVEADGQTVAQDQPFIVQGERLMWPGDTQFGASAENVIQCRCTQAYTTVR